jgi:hypothetical protein
VGPKAGPQRGAISCLCWESNLELLALQRCHQRWRQLGFKLCCRWIDTFLSFSVYPSVYIFICLSVCLSIYLVRPSVHLSTFLSSLYISPSVHTSIHLSNLYFYLYVPASVRPPLYVCPCTVCPSSSMYMSVSPPSCCPPVRPFALLSSFFLVVATLVPFV